MAKNYLFCGTKWLFYDFPYLNGKIVPFWYHNFWLINQKDQKSSLGFGLGLQVAPELQIEIVHNFGGINSDQTNPF